MQKKIKLKVLLSAELLTALESIYSKELPVETATTLVDIAGLIARKSKDVESFHRDLISRHVDPQAKAENGQYSVKDRAAYDAEYAAFWSKEADLDIPTISLSSLKGIRIKPSILALLLQTFVIPD